MAKGRCFYTRCTNAELKAFYRARTGKVDVADKIKNRPTKKDLANLLRKVDRRPWVHTTKKEFRFLDLPQELKNHIYHLSLGQSDRHPPVAALRTCKDEYAGASDALYRQAEVEIFCLKGRVRQSRVFFHYEVESQLSLANIRNNWPAYLLKVRHIDLKLEAQDTNPATHHATQGAINQELVGLVSFLSTSEVLTRVKVSYKGLIGTEEAETSMLRPLARVGPNVSIVFSDIASSGPHRISTIATTVKTTIQSEKASHTPAKHFFADYKETLANLYQLDPILTTIGLELTNQISDATLSYLNSFKGYVDTGVEMRLRETTFAAKARLAEGMSDNVFELASRAVAKRGMNEQPVAESEAALQRLKAMREKLAKPRQ